MDRLKINGMLLPDTYVERGSYHFDKQDRVIDQYTDADGIDHVIVSQKKRVVITFNFREHDIAEHAEFAKYLLARENATVDYYDDYLMENHSGNFRILSVDFNHYRKVGNEIKYAPASVTLTEY